MGTLPTHRSGSWTCTCNTTYYVQLLLIRSGLSTYCVHNEVIPCLVVNYCMYICTCIMSTLCCAHVLSPMALFFIKHLMYMCRTVGTCTCTFTSKVKPLPFTCIVYTCYSNQVLSREHRPRACLTQRCSFSTFARRSVMDGLYTHA